MGEGIGEKKLNIWIWNKEWSETIEWEGRIKISQSCNIYDRDRN